MNDIFKYPKCLACSKNVEKFNGHFHNGYYNKFCSQKCARSQTNPSDYCDNKLRMEKISKTRKENYINGLPIKWKEKLKVAANKTSVKNKRSETNLKKYGFENPGILGAYHSKEATEYIRKFILENNIDVECSYYYDKEKNKKEFYQNVFIPHLNKKKYCSYDLVVFKDKESADNKTLQNIILVLEYNGPWHYKFEDIVNHEDECAVPYKKNNSYKWTKKDVFVFDKYKIEHIKNFTKNIFIFWSNTKTLEKY